MKDHIQEIKGGRPPQSPQRIAQVDGDVYSRLCDLAHAGKPVPNNGFIGQPFKYSAKVVAKAMARLVTAGKIKIAVTGQARTVTIIDAGVALRIKPMRDAPSQWLARPRKAPPPSSIPPEAQAALDTLRRRYVAYAERESSTSTKLTGRYIVGRDTLELGDLLALAAQRKAA